METGLAIRVFSPVRNDSGKCEGNGSVEDYLGKSTEKEGSQEENRFVFLSVCMLWNS